MQAVVTGATGFIGSVLCRELWKRPSMPLIDGGRYSASLIYVDTLVDGIIRAGTCARAAGQVYHLRDDWQVTWKQYVADALLPRLMMRTPS